MIATAANNDTCGDTDWSGVTVYDGNQSTFYPSDLTFYLPEKLHHRWIKLEEEIKQRMPILPILASQHYQKPETVRRV